MIFLLVEDLFFFNAIDKSYKQQTKSGQFF